MIAFLVILLFQVNVQHPPIVVLLNRVEVNQLHMSTPTTTPEPDRVRDNLILVHHPADQPKPSCANGKPVEGYRGHRYFDDKIVYVWETPKCTERTK